ADNWPSARVLVPYPAIGRAILELFIAWPCAVLCHKEKNTWGPFKSGTWRYSAGPPNTLQTTFRTLQVSRCIDLAQLEDVETLAQCNRRLLRGTRYRTIYYFAREKSAWGAWLTILLDFDTFHVYQDQRFRGP